jgi:hypothetical protein
MAAWGGGVGERPRRPRAPQQRLAKPRPGRCHGDKGGSAHFCEVSRPPMSCRWPAWAEDHLFYRPSRRSALSNTGRRSTGSTYSYTASLRGFSGSYFFRDPVTSSYVFTSYETGHRYRLARLSGNVQGAGVGALGTAERTVVIGDDGRRLGTRAEGTDHRSGTVLGPRASPRSLWPRGKPSRSSPTRSHRVVTTGLMLPHSRATSCGRPLWNRLGSSNGPRC